MADFLNSFFATAATSGIPGEAESWTWTSVSAAGEWAEFNTVALFQAYQLALESFEAGFGLEWDRSYANEAARLSDGTLTANDIGVIARQEDTKGLFLLTAISPNIWQEISSSNNDWVSSLLTATVIAAIFNGASTTYEAQIETFNIWGEITWLAPGSPWVDVPVLRRQDSSDGLVAPYSLGFKGWYSTLLVSNELVLAEESFEEGWDNTPLESPAYPWIPGVCPGGVMRGKALTFPVVIPPEKNTFVIWYPPLDSIFQINVVAGEYANASDLAAELQTQWGISTPPITIDLEWGYWTDADGNSGLTFGHVGLVASEAVMFGVSEEFQEKDLRGLIGFTDLGPGGAASSDIEFLGSFVSTRPSWATPDDRFFFDRWTYISFIVDWDPVLLDHVLEYTNTPAVFNAFSTGPNTILESFLIADWFGAGAVWIPNILFYVQYWAVFDGGSGTVGIIESFENPTTYWPDELYQE